MFYHFRGGPQVGGVGMPVHYVQPHFCTLCKNELLEQKVRVVSHHHHQPLCWSCVPTPPPAPRLEQCPNRPRGGQDCLCKCKESHCINSLSYFAFLFCRKTRCAGAVFFQDQSCLLIPKLQNLLKLSGEILAIFQILVYSECR